MADWMKWLRSGSTLFLSFYFSRGSKERGLFFFVVVVVDC